MSTLHNFPKKLILIKQCLIFLYNMLYSPCYSINMFRIKTPSCVRVGTPTILTVKQGAVLSSVKLTVTRDVEDETTNNMSTGSKVHILK